MASEQHVPMEPSSGGILQREELLKVHQLQQQELFLRQQLELQQISQGIEALKLQLSNEQLAVPAEAQEAGGFNGGFAGGFTNDFTSKKKVRISKLRNAQGQLLDPWQWEDGPTTVMVRRLPRDYTQQQFLTAVEAHGFDGLFDFLYLPWDIRNGINMGGYGFVNFLHPEYALSFRDTFEGLQVEGKNIRVHPAQLQGFEANYQHFAASKIGHRPAYCPLVRPKTSG